MSVALGDVVFDAAHTAVRERYEEVGGRAERAVEISGLIVGEPSVAAIHSRLDAILEAASAEDYSAPLTLRPGRILLVRRAEFLRQVVEETLTGSFTLKLAAQSPFEESTAVHGFEWNIAGSGAQLALASNGNAPALAVVALFAVGDVVNPAVSDGEHTITYFGTVEDGSELLLDGRAGRATLDGADVTPYTSGQFARIAPEGSTLEYTDGTASSHTANAIVEFRDRWW
ncbi:MAG: hypothetical protein AMXMBFR4_07540 [Candidatus Hydrogenedentota bacterium]